MEWIKCSEKSPSKPGEILVRIGDKNFIGLVIDYAGITLHGYEISFITGLHSGHGDFKIYKRSPEWNYPKHFKELEYWMYIEKPIESE